MTQRPTPKAETLRATPIDRERALMLAVKSEIQRTAAKALSVVFATIAAVVVVTSALEFVRVRAAADTRAGCLAAAAQLPNPVDRIALITNVPACAVVVDVTRSN